MREIKFRAWNTLLNQFIENFESKYLIEVLSSDLFIINQFTGLKDKNGVDIYEGDILEYKNDLDRHNLAKIFYKKGGLCFNIHEDDFYKNPEEIFFYESCADMQSKGWIVQFEIIGNIHEHLNLLK